MQDHVDPDCETFAENGRLHHLHLFSIHPVLNVGIICLKSSLMGAPGLIIVPTSVILQLLRKTSYVLRYGLQGITRTTTGFFCILWLALALFQKVVVDMYAPYGMGSVGRGWIIAWILVFILYI